jgi:type II secretory pathway pseudopilin PulG
VHAWIPLGIVIVSVMAALMGWRASLADETSNRREELSRQDLVQQQQVIVRDNQSVGSDIRTFSTFAQTSGLAHSLRHDGDTLTGQISEQLLSEAQADLGVARSLGSQIRYQNYAFDATNPSGNAALRSGGTYAPGHPYRADEALDLAENSDPQLHGLAPEQLHESAESEKLRALHFEGVAALFVSVMVLLTVGALVKGPPKLWLSAGASTVAVAAVALAIVVQSA